MSGSGGLRVRWWVCVSKSRGPGRDPSPSREQAEGGGSDPGTLSRGPDFREVSTRRRGGTRSQERGRESGLTSAGSPRPLGPQFLLLSGRGGCSTGAVLRGPVMSTRVSTRGTGTVVDGARGNDERRGSMVPDGSGPLGKAAGGTGNLSTSGSLAEMPLGRGLRPRAPAPELNPRARSLRAPSWIGGENLSGQIPKHPFIFPSLHPFIRKLFREHQLSIHPLTHTSNHSYIYMFI